MPLPQLAARVGQTPFYAYERRFLQERVALLRRGSWTMGSERGRALWALGKGTLTALGATILGMLILAAALVFWRLSDGALLTLNQLLKLASILLGARVAVSAVPMMTSTCYSFVNGSEAMHEASVHQYDAVDQTMKIVPGSGGVSAAPSALEGGYALGWAQNIRADSLAL